jgi:hypothetical protein
VAAAGCERHHIRRKFCTTSAAETWDQNFSDL